jgi:anti-sigma B factor antagonist
VACGRSVLHDGRVPTPSSPDFTLSTESSDTAHVVRVEGELDLSTGPRLAALLAELPKPPMIVVLDFAALTFIDSTALRVLLTEHRRAREEHYEFVIAGATGPVREVFRITAFDITLPLVPDVASAIGE